MNNSVKKYRVTPNIEGFGTHDFLFKKEAIAHIQEDMVWAEDKPKYKNLSHTIVVVEVEEKKVLKEIFEYFDY